VNRSGDGYLGRFRTVSAPHAYRVAEPLGGAVLAAYHPGRRILRVPVQQADKGMVSMTTTSSTVGAVQARGLWADGFGRAGTRAAQFILLLIAVSGAVY
jgi:hypothetical protein